MRLKFSMIPAVSLLLLAGPAMAGTWSIDPAHSEGEFKVRHLTVTNVTGTIRGVEGKVDLNDADITKSKVEATMDARTIDTGNKNRDDHLRSPDFFNVGKCPQIKFVSTSVTGKTGDLKVMGNLTMNCTTKPVEMAVEGPTAPVKGMKGENRRGLTATTKINRKDFGISWNKNLDGGGLVVADEVAITLEVELSDAKVAH